MALLGNYSALNANPGRNIGGFTNLYDVYKLGSCYKFYCGEHIVSGVTNTSSINSGTYPPYSLVIAPVGGGLSATTLVVGSNAFTNANLAGGLLGASTMSQTSTLTSNIIGRGVILVSLAQLNTITANIAGQLNAVANLSQSSTLTADLGAIISILSQIDGINTLIGTAQGAIGVSATVNNTSVLSADISGQLNMLANIAQTSTVSASVIGSWLMQATVAQTSALTSNIQALGEAVANVIGSSDVSGNFTGTKGYMNAEITNISTLSPENLAAAVWNSVAASFNAAGTMGNKLNGAASAGDPWSTALPGLYADGEAGKILSQIQTLVDELHKIQGLSAGEPMTVNKTTGERTAGGITLSITGDDNTFVTVERQ